MNSSCKGDMQVPYLVRVRARALLRLQRRVCPHASRQAPSGPLGAPASWARSHGLGHDSGLLHHPGGQLLSHGVAGRAAAGAQDAGRWAQGQKVVVGQRLQDRARTGLRRLHGE